VKTALRKVFMVVRITTQMVTIGDTLKGVAVVLALLTFTSPVFGPRADVSHSYRRNKS